jgi:hypothetical protein
VFWAASHSTIRRFPNCLNNSTFIWREVKETESYDCRERQAIPGMPPIETDQRQVPVPGWPTRDRGNEMQRRFCAQLGHPIEIPVGRL